MSCPSCDHDLAYPGKPGHECYTYEEWRENIKRNVVADRPDKPQPNTHWYTEARVDQMMLDYRSRLDDLEGLLRERDVQLESLKRILALRTDAMHRVAEENEVLRAQHKTN